MTNFSKTKFNIVEGMEMEEKIKRDVVKIIVFITLVNLPFISVTQILGLDIFFDSFENPKSYQYFKNNMIDTIQNKYFVLQKSSHPDFSMSTGDSIIYIQLTPLNINGGALWQAHLFRTIFFA